MISQKSIEAIRRAIKFKYDEHVGNLISIPNAHLDKILPNKGMPISGILDGFNKDSGKELSRYGDEIKSEVFRILEKLRLSDFSEEDKKLILDIVDEYCKPELCLKRFKIILSSIQRKSSSYGQKVDLSKERIDIPRSLCEAYARNTTRRIRSKIENELDCIIESFKSKNNGSESKVSDEANCLELKPTDKRIQPMRKKSKIANNALKILGYLIDNNAMAGGDVKVQDIYNSVGLSGADFESADMYLLQQKYVEGTFGGMDGRRWLTGRGIDFYEETKSVIELDSNNQEVNQMPDPKKVFVVHGRDSRLRDDFFSFLRALGLQPIEWSEALRLTRKATPYIGEAIESAFKNAQAVIVLLSPDDEVRLSPELWKDNEDKNEKVIALQARPNVLFEAGMAFGINSDRTLLVEVGQVKAFSDVAGRHVVRLSNSSNRRNDIGERLRTAGCDVSTTGNDWLNIGNFEIIREQKTPSNINAYISDGNEEISHETLVLSKLIHPGLQDRSHNNCVITGRLFNKSNQKVVINRVRAYDRNSKPLSITWSNQIDQYGNPEKPYELIGFVDSEDIFVRQDNGEEIEYCKLEIFHSFSQEPLTCVFDEYEDWIDQ